MNISRISVKGYRSLKSVEWEPAGLNVLIGPNGSGKSNVLSVLELVAAAAQGRLSDHVLSAGGMGAILWDGKADAIWIEVRTTPLGEGMDPTTESLTYSLELGRLGASAAFQIQREALENRCKMEAGQVAQPFKFFERQRASARIFDPQLRGLVKVPNEAVQDQESFLSLAANPMLGNPVVTQFQIGLAGWTVHQAVEVGKKSILRQPTTTSHARRVSSDGGNLVPVLHTLYEADREFRQRLDETMRVAFGSAYDRLGFVPVANQQVQLSISWNGLAHATPAASLSDGTLRFLFLLAVLCSPEAAPVIAIDEPELGLHPAMFSLVAECAQEAARRSQVIMTTHSAQFLDAFGTSRPTTTVVKWAEGETRLVRLPDALLDEWLKAYSLGDLFKSGELENVE
jgi:predicted ATPase